MTLNQTHSLFKEQLEAFLEKYKEYHVEVSNDYHIDRENCDFYGGWIAGFSIGEYTLFK